MVTSNEDVQSALFHSAENTRFLPKTHNTKLVWFQSTCKKTNQTYIDPYPLTWCLIEAKIVNK